jgi:hypothetical protein
MLTLLVATTVFSQVPEWQSEIVLKADYGDAEDEFGFEGITDREDTSPVNAFYIGAEYIYWRSFPEQYQSIRSFRKIFTDDLDKVEAEWPRSTSPGCNRFIGL